MKTPYARPDELVDELLAWTTCLVRGEQPTGDAVQFAARRQASHEVADQCPLLWLEQRLGLTESELCVLFVLLAHELDPDVRAMLREQNTEQVSDVTFDTLRRVVYGSKAKLRVWRELGPHGTLRSLGLIERTDGTGEAPEHRQTFKVSPRVLALAYGDTSIDPSVRGLAKVCDRTPSLDDLELEPARDRSGA